MDKMDGLGIEKDDAERAITTGMKWKEQGAAKWHARQAGVEVVFVKQRNDFFIVTVYFGGEP